MTKRKKQSGYIYIIKSIDYIKIGFTINNVGKRIKGYECHNPYTEVVAVYPVADCFELEKELHKEFRDKRFKNEWFKLTKRDLGRIKFMCEKLDK